MKKLIYADELIHKLLTAIECGKRNDMPVHELEAVLADVRRMKAVDAVEVVRCKDCKHYELDSWANVNGIPLIVAHHICKRWGEGCKTDENGFCFMGEKVTE